MRISDWSSDVCSSDLVGARGAADTDALLRKVTERCLPNRILQVVAAGEALPEGHPAAGKGQVEDQATAYLCRGTVCSLPMTDPAKLAAALDAGAKRSEEHTSELQSLMRISYAVLCLQKKKHIHYMKSTKHTITNDKNIRRAIKI